MNCRALSASPVRGACAGLQVQQTERDVEPGPSLSQISAVAGVPVTSTTTAPAQASARDSAAR